MLFGPGGGATHLLHLCSALVKQGAEVTLICRHADRMTPVVKLRHAIPIRFITTPFAQTSTLYRLSTIWALIVWPFLLGHTKYDVLYTWEISPFLRFLSRFVRPGGQILLQRIGEPFAEDSTLDPSLEELLSGLIVETTLQADAAKRILKQDIPVFALPLIGHCASPPASDRDRPSEVFAITFLSRYHRDKGIYRLLEIWPKLKIGRAQLNFYAWGPEFDELRRRVDQLGLQGQIHLNEAYSTAAELSAILAQTDLVVLPSETEGLPVVLLESMAHGVPFVATDVGAVRTLAEDNPDVLVTANDDAAFKRGLEQMVEAIRSSKIDGHRLQKYYNERYGYERLSRLWVEALLNPAFMPRSTGEKEAVVVDLAAT